MDQIYAHRAIKYKDHPLEPHLKETLYEHIKNIINEIKDIAQYLNLPLANNELVRLFAAAFLHDIGKIKPEFQIKINGGKTAKKFSSSHTPIGTRLTKESNIEDGSSEILQYIIAGHHAGLAEGEDTLNKTINNSIESPYDDVDYVKEQAIIILHHLKIPSIAGLFTNPPQFPIYENDEDLSFVTRFLFGLFTTADHDATGKYYNKVHIQLGPENHPFKHSRPVDNLNQSRLKALRSYLDQKCKDGAKQSTTIQTKAINNHRTNWLKAANHVAQTKDSQFFSLDLPTGGGKTLTGLSFCYEYARRHKLKRIIYVAPFLNIIDQTTEVMSSALKINSRKNYRFICEHHSNSRTIEKLENDIAQRNNNDELDDMDFIYERMNEERWNQPLIITTMVQFISSMFADKPSKAQKLVNISNAVVFFDEFQSLPLDLRKDVSEEIDMMAKYLNTTFVFGSATNTPWQKIYGTKEIVPIVPREKPPTAFQRVKVKWDGDKNLVSLADELAKEHQAFAVVNIRKSAQMLALMLQEKNQPVLCLTTLQNRKQRLEVLAECRRRLDTGERILLISTQSIEAGVDIDFPKGYRQLAPLESIIQCAGRVNREGKMKKKGQLILFELADLKLHDNWYKKGAEYVLRQFYDKKTIDIYDPKVLDKYHSFQQFNAPPSKKIGNYNLSTYRRGRKYRTVKQQTNIIDLESQSILAPRDKSEYDEMIKLLLEIRSRHTIDGDRLSYSQIQAHKKKLNDLTISMHETDVEKLKCFGILKEQLDEADFPINYIEPAKIYHPLVGVMINSEVKSMAND